MSKHLNMLYLGIEGVKAVTEFLKTTDNKTSGQKSNAQQHMEYAIDGISEITSNVIGTVKGWLPSFETKNGTVENETKNVALYEDRIMISLPGIEKDNIKIGLTNENIIISLKETDKTKNPFNVAERIEIPVKHIIDKIQRSNIELKEGCLIVYIGKDELETELSIS